MLSKPVLLVRRTLRTLWVRVLLMMLLAVLALVLAELLAPVIPDWLTERINQDAAAPILNILASSLLAVTTFSLGVMVQSFQSAASQATPRAYRVLMQDTTAQTVLATFVGGFLFSLLALVLFYSDLYGSEAAVVVFCFTMLVIALIIVAILRWISYLRLLGSMGHTFSMVVVSAEEALDAAMRAPSLGARTLSDAPPDDATPFHAETSGYVQIVNVEWLQEQMEVADGTLWLCVGPGDHVVAGSELGRFKASGDTPDDLHTAFTMSDERSMEQDARYGLVVLSEIAARALSPGVNDPGTAIDAIRRLERLIWNAAQIEPDDDAEKFDRLYAKPLGADALVRDAYAVIVRDGAGRVEVMRQLVHALRVLERSERDDLREAARQMLRYLALHAKQAMTIEEDFAPFEHLLDEESAAAQ